MKRGIKIIIGVILIVLGCLALIGRIAQNSANGFPWYIVTGENDIVRISATAVNFMLWIGGILLLIPFRKKEAAANFDADNAGYYVLPGAKSKKKNALCITAFVLSIASLLLIGLTKIIPVIALVIIILACVGLKQAYDNDQSGTGLAKWALTISVSILLGALYIAILNVSVSPVAPVIPPTEHDSIEYSETVTEAAKQEKKTVEFSKGIVQGQTYESEFVGLRLTLPDNWVMRTDDEIKQIFGETYYDQYEMCAFNISSNENMMLLTEKLMSKNITLDQAIPVVENGLINAGMTVVSDQDTVSFCGKEYRDIVFNASVNGVNIKTELYLRKENDRLIYLMLQYLEANRGNIDAVLNCFTEYGQE